MKTIKIGKHKIKIDTSSHPYLGYILIILTIVLVFQSTRAFYTGFHNIDLVYNYQKISMEINPYLYEANISMNGVDEAMDNMGGRHPPMYLSEAYSMGTGQMLIGFNLMFIAGLTFIVGILSIENDKRKEGLS